MKDFGNTHIAGSLIAMIYRNRQSDFIESVNNHHFPIDLVTIKRKVIVLILDALDEIGSSGPGDRREFLQLLAQCSHEVF